MHRRQALKAFAGCPCVLPAASPQKFIGVTSGQRDLTNGAVSTQRTPLAPQVDSNHPLTSPAASVRGSYRSKSVGASGQTR
jgi:hypothetical protein